MRYQQTNERRAVILMVVLSLLTLFALVGITFVLYADAEAAAARVAREAETAQHADMDPQQALSFLLSQIIYDLPDTASGASSGLRGHSLARTMYGYNSLTPGLNITPYSGPGRVHTNGTTWPFLNTLNPPAFLDDYLLVNYTWFQKDGFARDPEWYTATPQAAPGAAKAAGTAYYVGGNAPYTYPDLNSFFLAAVRSDGTVLTPSFHRPWLSQLNPTSGTPYINPTTGLPYLFNDPLNPNWSSPWGKYMTLRPRPWEHPTFPMPDDAYGDVKNLPWSKTNDSIWIDPGGPVMTAPDGTPYKMLVAPCIIDLDNRINVGTAGNIAGGGIASRSNQGWFPSEVNLSALWSNCTALTPAGTPAANEWLNLFLGNPPLTPPTGYYGKYGKTQVPGGVPLPNPTLGGVVFPNGSPAHVYAQADLDGRNETAVVGAATTGIALPTTSVGNANPCFPLFPVGYGSGSAGERTNHPAYYNVYKSSYYNALNDNLVFRPSDMEALLRPNNLVAHTDAGSSALISNLMRLCPTSLGGTTSASVDLTAPQRRNWLTTVSADLARPGLSPWIYNPADPTSLYIVNPPTPWLPPVGAPVSFTKFAYRTAVPPPPNPPVGSEYTASWQSFTAALGRLDLNRPLPPYPHMSAGLRANLVGSNARYDSTAGSGMPANVQAQFFAAMTARQQLAIDIYTRLLLLTGVAPPSSLTAPTPADLTPRRWLAQLAANIVDYIDDDEISTPFNFFDPNTGLPASPVITPYQVDQVNTNTVVTPTNSTTPINGLSDLPPYYPNVGGNPGVPAYWVFGTELPRIVINEALGEYTYVLNSSGNPVSTNNNNPTSPPYYNVNIWVELFNPLPSPATVTGTATTNQTVLQPLDGTPEALYMPAAGPGTTAYNPYQIVIANNNLTANSNGLWFSSVGGLNNNVLGNPQQVRWAVSPTAAAPAGIPAGCNFGTVPSEPYAGMAATVANPGQANYSLYTPGLPGQSYLLVGPSAKDANNDITAANGVPGTTPFVISPNMTYQFMYNAPNNTWSITVPPAPGSAAGTATGTLTVTDSQQTGIMVLLRRLANPHLPPNPFTAAGKLLNLALPPNPYVTIDYASFTLNGYGSNNGTIQLLNPLPANYGGPKTPPPNSKEAPASFGKYQPYGGQLINQTTLRGGVNSHTFGLQNAPVTSPFTWLVHLDRALISPMELLHVSGFTPHLLTQRFIVGTPNPQLVLQPYSTPTTAAGTPNPNYYYPAGSLPGVAYFQHYVPWFHQTRRLYRFFEMVDTRNASAGVSPINGHVPGVSPINGRVPGKININTLWDPPAAYPQIYQAIADPPLVAANADNPNFTTGNVSTIFQTLLTGRTPGLTNAVPVLSGVDRPFVGMAAGAAPAVDSQYYPPINPTGMGINHTLLTDGQVDASALPTNQRLLQLTNTLTNSAPNYLQGAHPYMQNELLAKIYNRLTTRSNVYAVFLTIGFFQVTAPGGAGGSPNIPQLGPEIGRSEGKQIRHRMFAIVDRTNLSVMSLPFPTLTGSALAPNRAVPLNPITVLPGAPPTPYQVTFSALTGTNPFTGATWAILAGSTVVFEPGTDNEETVTLAPGTQPGQFTAAFYKGHAAGVPVILRGNPGPWTLFPYDPRLDPGVVPYFSIID